MNGWMGGIVESENGRESTQRARRIGGEPAKHANPEGIQGQRVRANHFPKAFGDSRRLSEFA